MDAIATLVTSGSAREVLGTPVRFPNRDGHRLFGMLHRPAGADGSEPAVLLLSPGVKGRVAPHRLYNKLTARLLALGVTVLRFDFHGLGDSEGEAPEQQLADLYAATQAGRYVDDTLAAVDWLERTCGSSQVIAAGLCGGALTGLLAAQVDRRITALIGLSIPVILDGTGVDASRFMTAAQLQQTRQSYLERLKLWNPRWWSSWFRLLTLQSDYKQIARSLWAAVQKRRRPTPSVTVTERADNTNPRFAPAFVAMASTRRPMVLIFAGADRLYHEFDEKFRQRHAATLHQHAGWFDVRVIEHANHVFSMASWQSEVMELCEQWLGDRRLTPLADARPVGRLRAEK